MKSQIVIIEDDKDLGEYLQNMLQQEKFSAELFRTGKDGKEHVNSETQLVILDVTLPDINGIEICKEIREKFPSLPIILLTAHGEQEWKDRALLAGATEYIEKPFSLDDILTRISVYIKP